MQCDDSKLLISGETFHSDSLCIVLDFTLTTLNALLEEQINGSIDTYITEDDVGVYIASLFRQ